MFGLGFLNSIFLGALATAAIPVVIHLLNRRRVRRIRFSSLAFLEEVTRRRLRKIDLRRILILLLRTLAVLFVVVAFARPTLRGAAFLSSGKAPKNIVVCLDASYSMGVEMEKGTAFSKAVELASDIVGDAGRQDVINVVVFADHAKIVFDGGTRSRPLAVNAINDAQITGEGTSIQSAIAAANDAISRSDVEGGEIYVVSDFRYNADSTIAIDKVGLKNVRVFFVPVSEGVADNVSIDRVLVPRKLLRPGEVVRVATTVTNHSPRNPASFTLELSVEGSRKAEKFMNLDPSTTTTVEFPVSFARWGTYRCRVSKNRDRLPIDDDRYFQLEISRSVPVTLVRGRTSATSKVSPAGTRSGPELSRRPDSPARTSVGAGLRPAAGFYVGKALNPRGDGQGEFDVTAVHQADLTVAALPPRSVMAWVDPLAVQQRHLALIERYVGRGGAVLMFLGDAEPELLRDAAFKKLIGARSLSLRKIASRESFTAFRKDHPIFEMFNAEELELLSRTRTSRYVAARGVAPDSVLAYVGNGDPAVWETSHGAGKVLVFAVSPDLDYGDVPLSPMFLPLIHTSVSYLASSGIAKRHVENRVGRPVYFDAHDRYAGSTQLVLRDPAGAISRPVVVETPQGDRRIICERPPGPGFYELRYDTTVVDLAAVNVDPRESNTNARSLPPSDPQGGTVTVTPEGDFETALRRAKEGREVYPIFFCLALAALVAESILGRRA